MTSIISFLKIIMPELQTVGMKESSFCLASDSPHLPGFCTFSTDTQMSLFEMKRCGRGEMSEDEEQP